MFDQEQLPNKHVTYKLPTRRPSLALQLISALLRYFCSWRSIHGVITHRRQRRPRSQQVCLSLLLMCVPHCLSVHALCIPWHALCNSHPPFIGVQNCGNKLITIIDLCVNTAPLSGHAEGCSLLRVCTVIEYHSVMLQVTSDLICLRYPPTHPPASGDHCRFGLC